MKIATDTSAGEAQAYVGTEFYTISDNYGEHTVTAHKCVAIYAPVDRGSGYGIRLVNERGQRLNPASGHGIYTDLADVAATVVKGHDVVIERLRAQASSLADQILATNESLEATIALRDKAAASLGQPVPVSDPAYA